MRVWRPAALRHQILSVDRHCPGEIANAVSPFLRRIIGSSRFFNAPRRVRRPSRYEELTLHTPTCCEAIQEMHWRQKSERLPSQSAVASSAFSFAKRDRQSLFSETGFRSPCFRHLMLLDQPGLSGREVDAAKRHCRDGARRLRPVGHRRHVDTCHADRASNLKCASARDQ